jgi:Prasinovirus endonuclease VII
MNNKKCNSCGINDQVNMRTKKCQECHNKVNEKRRKKYAEQFALPTNLEAAKLAKQNKKRCSQCDEIKNIGNFYASNGSICKSCSKENARQYRKSVQIIKQNKNIICDGCGIKRQTSDFRPCRKKCKECEKEYGRKYIEIKKQNINNMNIEINVDEDSDEIYLQKRKAKQLRSKEREKTDPSFKLYKTVKTRLREIVKNGYYKNLHTIEYIGCSTEFLHEWLKFNFQEDMTIENHGSHWHIDHVIPCNTFDLSNEQEQLLCFNWANLSPEIASYNLKKNNNIDKIQLECQLDRIFEFCLTKNIQLPNEYIGRVFKLINF